MITGRTCKAARADGQPCHMARLADSLYCWAHDPANAEAAAEARKMGGLRRRREGTLAGAFDFQGLTTVDDIRRLLEVAAFDTLGLENGISRSRTLVAVAVAAAKLLETGELEERVKILEAAVIHRREEPEYLFDQTDDDLAQFPEPED